MFSQFINRHNPLGCFVTERDVRLVQVVRVHGDVVELRAKTASVPTTDGTSPKERTKAVAEVVRQLFKSGGFQGKTAVSALPGEQLWCRKLRLAPMPDAEIAAAAHFLAARELGLGVETFTSETIKLATVREGSSKLEVLTIGADSAALEEQARMLVQAGLEPMALDAVPWATARMLTGSPSSGEVDPLLILDVHGKSTDMIIASKGQVLFMHHVEGGSLRIAELLAHRLDVSLTDARQMLDRRDGAAAEPKNDGAPPPPAEPVADAARMFGRELAREVSLSLYHFREVLHGVVPETGVMLGNVQGADEILSCVNQLTGVRFVEAPDLLAPGWRSAMSSLDRRIGDWLVVSGLALYDTNAQQAIPEAA